MSTNALSTLTEAALPTVAREIAGLIGLPKTLQLVEALGGTTFPVAKRETRLGEVRYQMLERVVGVEAANELTARYGGTDLYIPRCATALRNVRDAAIVADFDRETQNRSANAVVAEIALRYRLSDRRVWLILKEVPCITAPQRQPASLQGRLV